eukprot:2831422-Rhodomonas_salina.1
MFSNALQDHVSVPCCACRNAEAELAFVKRLRFAKTPPILAIYISRFEARGNVRQTPPPHPTRLSTTPGLV